MEAKVLNIKGQDTGRTVVLNDDVYAIEPNEHAIYLDVKLIMANRRQGTAKTRERSEMSGSTRKLGRQKGGGGARRGDINSPVLVGGARVFGPKPRNYGFKLNKKLRQLARKSALTYKAQENAIVVVEDFTFDTAKTKSMLELLKNLNISGKKALVVTPAPDKVVYLSARNIKSIATSTAALLNTYTVLNADVIVLEESAVPVIDANLNK